MKYVTISRFGSAAALALFSAAADADESLFGYLKGAETLPKGAIEVVQSVTRRWDKGAGDYTAYDSKTELEYGVTDRFTSAVYLLGQSVKTQDILIDGYIPKDADTGLKLSGFEVSAKYNFLSPAKDDFGLAGYVSGAYTTLDPHSGQKKDKYTVEGWLLGQKNFLDDQLVWVGNVGLESTYAVRLPIDGMVLTQDQWPTTPEMEIALLAGTGVSYRIAPNWFIGVEALYDTEFETEVGQERWSVQAGPNVHYGAKDWWFTATWLPQLVGGGFETYPGQIDTNLHLIEKTKQEFRLKIGFNF
ncbi:MAG TPA: hypothetical protein DCQ77_13480 [Betaproteobacteria bacterium]|nr:hypothetical protein [Betaproteobacteria bacterium]